MESTRKREGRRTATNDRCELRLGAAVAEEDNRIRRRLAEGDDAAAEEELHGREGGSSGNGE
jgi:hypothetical protein